MSSPKIKSKPLKTERIVETVKESIRKGDLKNGERLPSLADMAKMFSSNRSLVYRGLLELVAEGMIECRGPRGFFVNGRESAEKGKRTVGKKTASPTEDGRIFFSFGHHSDLVWKYPYAAYDEIRTVQLDDMAGFFGKHPEMHAYVEQAAVMERYFEMRPEKKQIFLDAWKAGHFQLMGGYCIVDQNLCSGELQVRNMQLGRKVYRELFGAETDVADADDAFGMCAQYPQILAKSGIRFLSPGRMVNPPDDLDTGKPFFWKAPDGSGVTVVPFGPGVVDSGFVCNWELLLTANETLALTLSSLHDNPSTEDLLVNYSSETPRLRESVFQLLEQINRLPGGRRIEFGSISDYATRLNRKELPVFSGEFNPTFTGCYTTRIEVKQAMRESENLLFAAEMLAAGTGCAFDSGEAWKQLILTAFHDGICGCHSDAANDAIMEKFRFVKDECRAALTRAAKKRGGAFVFNPGRGGLRVLELDEAVGIEGADAQTSAEGKTICVLDLPACGIQSVELSGKTPEREKECASSFETKFFKVDFSTPFPSIFSKKLSAEISHDGFGEILTSYEYGSMWTEQISYSNMGRAHQTERVLSVVSGPAAVRVITEGQVVLPKDMMERNTCFGKGFESLLFRKEYCFPQKLDFFTVDIELDFHGCDTKVSVRFPVDLDVLSSSPLYGIPFGSMVRPPYFEVEKKYESTLKRLNRCTKAAGSWPALNWCDYSDPDFGLAAADNGIPGRQMVNGFLYFSLLRSGSAIQDGEMKPEPGALENGTHHFRLAFFPHKTADSDSVPGLSDEINRKPFFFRNPEKGKDEPSKNLASFNKKNIILSSLRRTGEKEWVLRAFETLGKKVVAKLSSDVTGFLLSESDLREEIWTPVNPEELSFTPFEIKTLKLEWKK